MRSTPGLPVLLQAGLAACRSGVADPALEPVPNDLRSTVPADSAEYVGADGPIAITVVFQQPVASDAIQLDLFPPPRAIGQLTLSPTGRVATLHDVELSTAQPASVLLVDGTDLRAPRLVHFFPGSTWSAHGRLGGCITGRPLEPPVSQALVFAVDAAEVSHDADSFLETSRAERFMVTTAEFGTPDCDAYYWMRFLDVSRRYLLFAILDTNRDAAYDIASDWWGVYHETGQPTAVAVAPGVLTAPTWLDIELRPPFTP